MVADGREVSAAGANSMSATASLRSSATYQGEVRHVSALGTSRCQPGDDIVRLRITQFNSMTNAKSVPSELSYPALFVVKAIAWCAVTLPVQAEPEPPLLFTGAATCISCHPGQAELWRDSHHARSMQLAEEKSVLGNFENVRLNHHDQVTRFFRRGGKFFVRTTGPDGKSHDFAIAYTFGISPLQQYLVALPGGRLQALGEAWDARSRQQGGQR